MDKKHGYEQKNVSLHSSVKSKLIQYAKDSGVSDSDFVSRLIETYGPALKKKLTGE